MMKSLENKIPPPFVTLIIGTAMWSLKYLQPPMHIEPRLHYALTGIIALFAPLVATPAFVAFRRAKTTINPVQIDRASRVVTGGIYRFTRNPMYVGLTALLTAWGVWLAVPLALLGPVAFALFTQRFQILPEERVMHARFGGLYDAYRQRVRRWI